VTFERREEHLIADFDLESHELYSFRKTLPAKMRPEKNGRKIVIKNPAAFNEWLALEDTDDGSEGGFLSRLFS